MPLTTPVRGTAGRLTKVTATFPRAHAPSTRRPRVLLRLLRLAAAIAAVLALAGPPSPVAGHMNHCLTSGILMRYVVLFEAETSEYQAAHAVQAACGTSTIYYSQIGVGVVTSTDPTFVARFGADRAYSAQAEAGASPQRATTL